jgi:autotransporter-associated beta strand protein
MATVTWNGTTTSTDYMDFNNWVPSFVPSDPDTATFGTGGRPVVTVTSNSSVGAWQFTGGNYTNTIAGSVTLVFSGAGVQVAGGSATIVLAERAKLSFDSSSDGGAAAYVLDFQSEIGISGKGGNFHVGSLEGDSTTIVALFDANQTLVVGGNNRSTTFAGIIDPFEPGFALVKVGTGTWTFSGSFGGPITIAGGTFDLDMANVSGSHSFIFGPNPAETLSIENAALFNGNFFAPPISALGAGDTIDLPGLPFVPGATTTGFGLVTNGTTTVHFFSVSVAGANDDALALGDDHGGTRVMLGILGTSGKNLVDATHHPVGQVASSNRPDLILGLGGNDVLKGLGGNDILVGGAGKDALYGGAGADTFVYQQLADSRPAHPDTIEDFKHAQHDKIDLFDLFHAANHLALRFIGAETFHQYQHAHHAVIGMVRYAGGEVQVNVNANLAPDLAIVMNGAPVLHGNDFIL